MQRSLLYDLKDDLLAFLFLWGPPLETQREYARAVFKLVLRILFFEVILYCFNKTVVEPGILVDFLSSVIVYLCGIMYLIPFAVLVTRRLRGKGETSRNVALTLIFAQLDSLKYASDWLYSPQRYAIEAFILLLLASDIELEVPPRDWKIASAALIFFYFFP